MNSKTVMRIDILNMLLRFMIAFTLISMIGLIYTNDATYVWKCWYLFLASALSFLISRIAKHIWVYCILHILLLGGYILIADTTVLRILYILFIVGYALFQFGLDIDGKVRNTSIIFVGVFLSMFLICKYGYPKEIMLNRFFLIFGIIYGMLYILNRHQVNFYYYLKKYEDKANIPFQQINRSNHTFIIIFVILSSISTLFFIRLPLGRVLYHLGILLRNLLKALLSGLKNTPPEVKEEESILPEEDFAIEEMLPMEEQTPSEFWIAVSKVLLVATSVLFVILVIALIIYGLYKIYKKYYQTKGQGSGEEQIEVLSPFEKLDLGYTRGKRSLQQAIHQLIDRSNNDRIRKQYRKAIQRNTKSDKILKYYTPTELSKYAVDTDKQKLEKEKAQEAEKTLTALYEKARYSNTECSKEEVLSVKNIIK